MGMSKEQAEAVMVIAKKDLHEFDTSYDIKWNLPYIGESKAMLNVYFTYIKSAALLWLNAHKPLAWFKPVFEPKQPA